MMSSYNHSDLLSSLKNGEIKAFEIIYDRFADRLYQYIFRRIRNREVSEEIVQEIFVSLWKKRETLEITLSLDAWLFGAAKYSILSYIRSEHVRKKYVAHFMLFARQYFDNSSEELMDLKDLQANIESTISQLPEKCRTAFHLSRMEHEPIARIAERMNISQRTVENYLSQALKHLRTSLNQLL